MQPAIEPHIAVAIDRLQRQRRRAGRGGGQFLIGELQNGGKRVVEAILLDDLERTGAIEYYQD